MIGQFITELSHCPELAGSRPIHLDSSLLNHPQGAFIKLQDADMGNGTTSSISANMRGPEDFFGQTQQQPAGGGGSKRGTAPSSSSFKAPQQSPRAPKRPRQ